LNKIFSKYITWRKNLDLRFNEGLNNWYTLNYSYNFHNNKELVIENLLLDVIKFFGRDDYEDFIPLDNSLINIDVLILYCNYLEDLENLELNDDWITYENILTYDKFYHKLKQEFIIEITWNTEKDKDFSISFIETLSQDEILLLRKFINGKNINESNDNKDTLAFLGQKRSYHSYAKLSKPLKNNAMIKNSFNFRQFSLHLFTANRNVNTILTDTLISNINRTDNLFLIRLNIIFNKYIIWRINWDLRSNKNINHWNFLNNNGIELLFCELILEVGAFFDKRKEDYENYLPKDIFNSINIDILMLYCAFLQHLDLNDDSTPCSHILTYDAYYREVKKDFMLEFTLSDDTYFSSSFIKALSQDEILFMNRLISESNIENKNISKINKDIFSFLGQRRSYHSYTKISKSLNNNALETNITIVGIYVTSIIYYFRKIVNQIKITFALIKNNLNIIINNRINLHTKCYLVGNLNNLINNFYDFIKRYWNKIFYKGLIVSILPITLVDTTSLPIKWVSTLKELSDVINEDGNYSCVEAGLSHWNDLNYLSIWKDYNELLMNPYNWIRIKLSKILVGNNNIFKLTDSEVYEILCVFYPVSINLINLTLEMYLKNWNKEVAWYNVINYKYLKLCSLSSEEGLLREHFNFVGEYVVFDKSFFELKDFITLLCGPENVSSIDWIKTKVLQNFSIDLKDNLEVYEWLNKRYPNIYNIILFIINSNLSKAESAEELFSLCKTFTSKETFSFDNLNSSLILFLGLNNKNYLKKYNLFSSFYSFVQKRLYYTIYTIILLILLTIIFVVLYNIFSFNEIITTIFSIKLGMLPLIKYKSITINEDLDKLSSLEIIKKVYGNQTGSERFQAFRDDLEINADNRVINFDNYWYRMCLRGDDFIRIGNKNRIHNVWKQLETTEFWDNYIENKFFDAKLRAYGWLVLYQNAYNKEIIDSTLLSQILYKISVETHNSSFYHTFMTMDAKTALAKWNTYFTYTVFSDYSDNLCSRKRYFFESDGTNYSLDLVKIFNCVLFYWDPEFSNPITFIKSIYNEFLHDKSNKEIYDFILDCYPHPRAQARISKFFETCYWTYFDTEKEHRLVDFWEDSIDNEIYSNSDSDSSMNLIEIEIDNEIDNNSSMDLSSDSDFDSDSDDSNISLGFIFIPLWFKNILGGFKNKSKLSKNEIRNKQIQKKLEIINSLSKNEKYYEHLVKVSNLSINLNDNKFKKVFRIIIYLISKLFSKKLFTKIIMLPILLIISRWVFKYIIDINIFPNLINTVHADTGSDLKFESKNVSITQSTEHSLKKTVDRIFRKVWKIYYYGPRMWYYNLVIKQNNLDRKDAIPLAYIKKGKLSESMLNLLEDLDNPYAQYENANFINWIKQPELIKTSESYRQVELRRQEFIKHYGLNQNISNLSNNSNNLSRPNDFTNHQNFKSEWFNFGHESTTIPLLSDGTEFIQGSSSNPLLNQYNIRETNYLKQTNLEKNKNLFGNPLNLLSLLRRIWIKAI
jgi:hypothetical protein